MSPEELVKMVQAEVAKGGINDEVAKAVAKTFEGYLSARFAPQTEGLRSPGEQFAAHESVRDFNSVQARNTPQIPIRLNGYGLKQGERLNPIVRTTVDTTFFPSERTYLPPAEFPQRALRLRDVIPVQGLGTPQIEYARITGYTASAGGVAEAATKPEAAITTQLIVDSVKTLASFIPVTRQALRDVNGLGAYINSVLGYFLQLVEDNQILNGAGVANMTGIRNTPGILTQVFSTNIIETVRKGITKLQTAFTDSGFEASALIVNPNDWETAELIKDTTNRYILIEVPALNPRQAQLWRVPVVVTPAMPAGKGLLGAFDIGCTLWTYEDLTLRITDSHSDWFIKNLLAVLAEFRELLAVYFPKAFVELSMV